MSNKNINLVYIRKFPPHNEVCPMDTGEFMEGYCDRCTFLDCSARKEMN